MSFCLFNHLFNQLRQKFVSSFVAGRKIFSVTIFRSWLFLFDDELSWFFILEVVEVYFELKKIAASRSRKCLSPDIIPSYNFVLPAFRPHKLQVSWDEFHPVYILCISVDNQNKLLPRSQLYNHNKRFYNVPYLTRQFLLAIITDCMVPNALAIVGDPGLNWVNGKRGDITII